MYPFVRPNPLQQIMDALNQGDIAPTYGGATGGGYEAPSLGQPSADPMSALISRISAPQPYQKMQEQPEASKRQKVLAGIKDAIAGYIEGRTGRAPGYAGAQDRIRATRERNQQIREANRLGEERAKAESDKQSALLEYQRLQQQHEEAVKAAEQAAARAEKLREDKVQSSRFIAEQASINERQNKQIEADKELAQLRGEIKVKEIQAKPAKAPKPDAEVAKQRKKAEEVMKFIGGAAPQLDALLTKGTQTPDDIRRTLQREMDARGLEGEDRQRVINFFAKHILPILKKHEAASAIGG